MAVTVTWDGHGRVTPADVLDASWLGPFKIAGGGSAGALSLADDKIEGAGAITARPNRQRVSFYYDLGLGNELDFSGLGAQVGQLIYVWSKELVASLLQPKNSGGWGITIDSNVPSVTQYHLWYLEGSDTYTGGWRRLVIDPTTAPSVSSGTALDLSSIRYIGVWADNQGTTTSRFENLIMDAVDVGRGLIVTGTSTTDDFFGDLLANEATNRYGIVTEKKGAASSGRAIELAGRLTIGDNVGVAATTVSDINTKVFAAEPTYWDGNSTEPAVPVGAFGIRCVGNLVGATDIQFGKKVGTGDNATGRNGIALVGNPTFDVFVDFDDGNVDGSRWYGCSLEDLTGPLTWGTNTAHECIGNTLSGCSQFDPVGGVVIRGCNFVSLDDDGIQTNQSALLWNGSIDIKNSRFVNNDIPTTRVGHDIEIPTAGTINFDNLQTQGAEQEILFSAASGNLTVNNLTGSNFSTTPADHTVTGTGTITVNLTVSHTLTGILENSEVTYVRDSDQAELFHVENVTASGTTTYAFDGALVGTAVTILVFKEDQEPIALPITLESVDRTVPIQQETDRDYAP